MNNTEKICSLLEEIKQELLEFEQSTISIISCERDSIEKLSQNRVTITQEMDKRFHEIDLVCDEMENGSRLKKIIKNVSSYSECDKEDETVYFKAQELFSIVTRIKDSEIQAVDRINLEKEMLLKKISEANNTQAAKASKFKVGTDSGNQIHFEENKTTI